MTPSAGRRHRDAGHGERTSEQRLATIHLRTGSLSLARAELETLAGEGALDDESLIDLAEVRWRTGDLPGAGEAADAYLEAGHETTLGLVISAEAHALLGRPTEARRLADRAIARADRSLDGVFAGLPRSSIWPRAVGTEALAQPESTGAASVVAGRRRAVSGGATAATTEHGDAGPATAAAGHVPDGSRALRAAEEALAAGDPAGAAIQLGLALRASPALAPAVLDVVRDQDGPAFDLIRGDAYRLVGREGEARRSFAAAAVDRPDTDDPDMPADIDPGDPASPDSVEGS
jgi:tetratricopeptide (TPR) repeat protein